MYNNCTLQSIEIVYAHHYLIIVVFVIYNSQNFNEYHIAFLRTYITYLCKCNVFIRIDAWGFISWYLNESSVYSDPGVYFYCSPVQSRKARASTGVCELDSMVIGQHIYKRVY